jgi:hypothetical protein
VGGHGLLVGREGGCAMVQTTRTKEQPTIGLSAEFPSYLPSQSPFPPASCPPGTLLISLPMPYYDRTRVIFFSFLHFFFSLFPTSRPHFSRTCLLLFAQIFLHFARLFIRVSVPSIRRPLHTPSEPCLGCGECKEGGKARREE